MSSEKATRAEDLRLDSTYFVAFEMAHDALKQGLANASSLNVTQYRVLAKVLAGTYEAPMSQSALGSHLGLAPNVVTQAVRVLEDKGFVERKPGDDARTRYLTGTKAGSAHVAQVNASIVEALYATFPTENPTYRTILEAAIAAGSMIEPPIDDAAAKRNPATRALVSVELIRQETERTLKAACGASYNECRVVQRLSEVGVPTRIGTLADALDMSSVNVARAVDRLTQRGWACRLGSPTDKKAVYVSLTDEGVFQGNVIENTVNELANARLWGSLSREHREAINKMGHVVIAELQAQKEAAKQTALEKLHPLT